MCEKTRHMEDEGMALQMQLADWLELSENLGNSTFLDYGYIPWAHHGLAVTISLVYNINFFVTSSATGSSF